MIQHFCAIAVDYQNGIFSGEDKIIAEVTGQPPMTVQQFVSLHRDAFRQSMLPPDALPLTQPLSARGSLGDEN
jgi:hypothetical protein